MTQQGKHRCSVRIVHTSVVFLEGVDYTMPLVTWQRELTSQLNDVTALTDQDKTWSVCDGIA